MLNVYFGRKKLSDNPCAIHLARRSYQVFSMSDGNPLCCLEMLIESFLHKRNKSTPGYFGLCTHFPLLALLPPGSKCYVTKSPKRKRQCFHKNHTYYYWFSMFLKKLIREVLIYRFCFLSMHLPLFFQYHWMM